MRHRVDTGCGTDGRTEWNQYTPPTTSFCGGYNKKTNISTTIYSQHTVSNEPTDESFQYCFVILTNKWPTLWWWQKYNEAVPAIILVGVAHRPWRLIDSQLVYAIRLVCAGGASRSTSIYPLQYYHMIRIVVHIVSDMIRIVVQVVSDMIHIVVHIVSWPLYCDTCHIVKHLYDIL